MIGQLDPQPLELSWNVLKNKVILVQGRVIDPGVYQWPMPIEKWNNFSGRVTSDEQVARYIQVKMEIGIHMG